MLPLNKPQFSSMGKIAYGTRGGGEQTAELIRDAILNGFRHIATSSHHINHNETGVGMGWKKAVQENPSIHRSDLFLQTMFVPWDGNDFQKQPADHQSVDPSLSSPPSIADQVKLTIEQSLQNLQTTYIDAVLYHNFRANHHPHEDMIQAWRVLEDYVHRGVIRQLGITNCHNVEYLTKLYNEATVKPAIVQNRFHSNRGFDVALRPVFQHFRVQVQRFWILTGNGGGIKQNADMAQRKGLTSEQLMLAFVMSLGDTALVGTHNVQHMKDDLEVAKKHEDMLEDWERKEFAKNIGMSALMHNA